MRWYISTFITSTAICQMSSFTTALEIQPIVFAPTPLPSTTTLLPAAIGLEDHPSVVKNSGGLKEMDGDAQAKDSVSNTPSTLPSVPKTSSSVLTPTTSKTVSIGSSKNTSWKSVTLKPKSTNSVTFVDTETNSNDSDLDMLGSTINDALIYACACKPVRKVSLMGASDYCLTPEASIANKCGNPVVGTKGECPRAGAQPCSDTGHVLANDSMCLFDKRDKIHKCVASEDDFSIQKYGRIVKKKKKSSRSDSQISTEPSLAHQFGISLIQALGIMGSTIFFLVLLT